MTRVVYSAMREHTSGWYQRVTLSFKLASLSLAVLDLNGACQVCPNMLTRQTKEQSDISCFANVASRVERQNITLGHQVVHDGEYTLFHFASIGCSCKH